MASEGSSARILNDRTGCTVLDWASHFGPRSVYTKMPVKNLAELKGVKLRVLPAPAFIETFKIMGAIPTPIPINELYTALQTGVVDGFEHDQASVLQYKFAEQVKYCWLTEHLFSPMVAVIGKRGLEKIPADARPAFFKAAKDATVYERGVAAEKGKAAMEELKRMGVTFTPMAKGGARPGAQGDGSQGLGFVHQGVSRHQAHVRRHQRRTRLTQKNRGVNRTDDPRRQRCPRALPQRGVGRARADRVAACPRIPFRADPRARRPGRFRGGDLSLLPARPGGLGGGNRAGADGHASVLWRRHGSRPRTPRRHRQLPRASAGAMAARR